MKKLLATLLISLVCAASGFAECYAELWKPHAEPASRNIRITTTLLGKPIENARVDLYFPGAAIEADLSGRKPDLTLHTDKDGIAVASALHAGHYVVVTTWTDKFKRAATSLYLEVSKSRKGEPTAFIMEFWPGIYPMTNARDRAAAEASPVKFHVKPVQGLVRGGFADATGGGMSGAEIKIWRKGSTATTPLMETEADQQGRFTATLPNGTYVGFVFMDGYRTKSFVFEVTDDGDTADMQIGLIDVWSC
jgi:5-hydroxyisourate hydrolase-like protein (transthyretin family)